jgi:hypothetical protein
VLLRSRGRRTGPHRPGRVGSTGPLVFARICSVPALDLDRAAPRRTALRCAPSPCTPLASSSPQKRPCSTRLISTSRPARPATCPRVTTLGNAHAGRGPALLHPR